MKAIVNFEENIPNITYPYYSLIYDRIVHFVLPYYGDARNVSFYTKGDFEL